MPNSPESLGKDVNLISSWLELLRNIEEFEEADVEFINESGLNEEDVLGYIYGVLLERGHNPDEILERIGITETDGN